MQHYRKTILVFPDDPSISFLEPIVTHIKSIYTDFVIFSPQHGGRLVVDDDVELVIFLGHGSSSSLYGGLSPEGVKDEFLTVVNASILFRDISVILLSCRSDEFLLNVNRNVQLRGYIGFGDMPTDWNDVETVRQTNPKYLENFTEEHLSFYNESIVSAFISGLSFINDLNPTRAFFLGMKLIINRRINAVLLEHDWKRDIKLQMIELLKKLIKETKHSYSFSEN